MASLDSSVVLSSVISSENDSHGTEDSERAEISLKKLRASIPEHCWHPLRSRAIYYICRDLGLAVLCSSAAVQLIPCLDTIYLRGLAWAAYGYVQGLVFTGIWVLGHEAGHRALFSDKFANNIVGFFLHSFEFTPFFSWQSSHRRHHIFTNNMKKDLVWVPPRRLTYLSRLEKVGIQITEITEDSPLFTLMRILLQQLLGWPWYLLTNITAASQSMESSQASGLFSNGHFLTSSTLFRPEETPSILLSNAGICAMAAMLVSAARMSSWSTVALLYLQPYLWLNHWIVAITYLHHTHPKVPKYDDEAWTYLKGALSTIDRDLGWVGQYLFHDVADYHVIHHIFPRIPFYYGREATAAIKPILGELYREERGSSFWYALYNTFLRCQWVEVNDTQKPVNQRSLHFKGGPSPPVLVRMT